MSFLESLINNLAAEGRKVSNAVKDTDFQIDDLRDEIRQLRREVSGLSRAARRSSAKALKEGFDHAEDVAANTVDTVKKHPGVSVLALFATGYFVSRLFRDR